VLWHTTTQPSDLSSSKLRPWVSQVIREGSNFPIRTTWRSLALAADLRAEKLEDLPAAINQAVGADGPAIIDCIVDPNELPNFLRVEFDPARPPLNQPMGFNRSVRQGYYSSRLKTQRVSCGQID
jgi:predicted secreted protein